MAQLEQTEREREAALYVSEAIALVDDIEAAKPQGCSDYPENPHRGRKDTRPMTMKDAKRLARQSAALLRKAWDVLDPTA